MRLKWFIDKLKATKEDHEKTTKSLQEKMSNHSEELKLCFGEKMAKPKRKNLKPLMQRSTRKIMV
jgi:hypothetical protein